MIFIAHEYQKAAARFLLNRPLSAIFADPGTGKTAILLMVLSALKRKGALGPVLVTAPLRIATQVWPEEIKKWDQFHGLTFEVLHGTGKDKAASRPADIHLVNNEGLQWLAKTERLRKYQTLVIDESSKFKNWMSQRTKLLRLARRYFSRIHILTGTPIPKSMLDLFAQIYLVDGGAALGPYLTHYRIKYFRDHNASALYGFPDWRINDGAEEEIYKAIAPICYRLDGERLLDMPDLVVNDIMLDLPDRVQREALERLKSLNLALPLSASADYAFSRQLAGGVTTSRLVVHEAKFKALEDLLEELQGKPAIVFFYYRAEGEELSKRFDAPRIDGTTGAKGSMDLIRRWNAREIPLLCLHPAAAGHGLNLQAGGNDVVWFSFTDNQDDYYQGIRRIYRQGVKGSVRVHRLIARRSIDVAMVAALEDKTNAQKAFLDAIRELTK
jgi:SNF2 family DNA or RNA helicase